VCVYVCVCCVCVVLLLFSQLYIPIATDMDYFTCSGSHDFIELVAMYLTVSDLGSLEACSPHYRAACLPVLTTRLEWSWSDVRRWPADSDRLQYVRALCIPGNKPRPVAGMLPAGLTHLTLGYRFNQPLSVGLLPAGLKYLSFGTHSRLNPGEMAHRSVFNRRLTVGMLPNSLTMLRFGTEYNQPLDVGVLPAGLTMLSFGVDFNQTLKAGVLPAGLEQLSFDSIRHVFGLKAAGVLPASVRTVSFGVGHTHDHLDYPWSPPSCHTMHPRVPRGRARLWCIAAAAVSTTP
jgi:hypothetical protein